jgi:hypothetical protein
MLLNDVKKGDLLMVRRGPRGDCNLVLVLDIIPIPNKHGGPNVSILDRGAEYHVRNTQVWPIEEDDITS